VEQFKKEEGRKIPDDIDYSAITGLRIEAAQKLSKVRPSSVGQAGRISGVSPADITVLLIYLEKIRGEGSDAAGNFGKRLPGKRDFVDRSAKKTLRAIYRRAS
jgi:hypothetical protein